MAIVNRKVIGTPSQDDTALQINIKVDGKLEVTDSKGKPVKPRPIFNEHLLKLSGINEFKTLMVGGRKKQRICICNDAGCRCYEI